MEFRTILHQNVTAPEWDKHILQIEESTFLHTWNWIQYSHLYNKETKQDSFILLDNQNTPLAVCPMGFSVDQNTGLRELAISGNFIGTPAVVNIKPKLRRKIQSAVYDRMRSYALEHSIQRIRMVTNPLTHGFCKGTTYAGMNSFEPQKFQFLADVENTAIMDLSLSDDALTENLSPTQRKLYRRTRDQGITMRIFSKGENESEVKKYTEAMRQAHYQSAKRWTRPQATWELMAEQALQGSATLFVSFINGTDPVSFLFCGEYSSMAYGWSQVNFDEYEQKYALRHFLEWEAICHYKRKGFKFYEVGERHFGATWLSEFTQKEINISEFKERFGGLMLPKIFWTGFLDASILKLALEQSSAAIQRQPLRLSTAIDSTSKDSE